MGGIALGSAALLVLAIAFAWQPEIVAIPPPAASSFDRNLIAEGEDLAKMGNCAGCHTADPARPLAGGRGISTPFGTVFARVVAYRMRIAPEIVAMIITMIMKAMDIITKTVVARAMDIITTNRSMNIMNTRVIIMTAVLVVDIMRTKNTKIYAGLL